MVNLTVEELREIAEKKVKKPRKLLVRSQLYVKNIQRAVERIVTTAKNFKKDLHAGSFAQKRVVKTHDQLVGELKKLEMSLEILLQTLGEEYAVVHADWPQEYVENLRLVDEKVNTMLKKIIPLAREQLARIDRSANITKAHYLSPEEAKSAPVFIARASENLIHYLKEVIGENLSEIAKLLAIEKALFATEINFLMSEEAGKHFKENGGVYLAEIIRMLNKFFDLRDGNGDKVINFVGSYRLGTKTEDVGHSPVTKTFLHLEMWDSHYDKNGHQVGYLKASAHIEYVLGSQKFYVKVYKLSSYGHSHHEPPALFGDMDSNSMTEILTYVLGRCGYYWAGSRRA